MIIPPTGPGDANVVSMHHETPFKIGLAETDAFGVVYHPHALDLAQQNLESWLEHLGLPLHTIFDDYQWALPVVRVELDWNRPLQLGDQGLTILTGIDQGERSLTLTHSIQTGGDSVATVKVVHACLDRRSGKTILLPDVLLKQLPV
ncbi:MAG: hypothetical protein CMJ28_06245 [Phycisphaerae bacterium]|nr:hypothetical protein [Phycisphaerae bacterium]